MKEYRDFYFKKAKAENYPARSIYKLQEIDAKFRLFAKGQKVLDLGAAPGSWSLGSAEKVGKTGLVLACDIQETVTAFPENVYFYKEDVFSVSENFERLLNEFAPFDIVLSDMAPATTGSRFTDQARSYELANAAFELACRCLKPGGKFVAKIFMGPDVRQLENFIRKTFDYAKSFKPKSSRMESKEIFLVGLGFKTKPEVEL